MRKLIWVASGLLVGLICAGVISEVQASRNSAGTMSGVNGPFVSGQVIGSSLLNNRYSDIESEITNSLDRSGRGGMLAALRGIDGTLAAPAFSWTSETGSGLFRNGASDVRMSIAGALVEKWAPATATLTGTTATQYIINANAAATQAALVLQDQGTTKYLLSKQTNNSAIFFDNANSRNVWSYTPGASAPLIVDAGLQVGATGNGISASYRGTTSWTPGSLAALNCTNTSITLTGAAAGAEAVVSSPGSLSGPFSIYGYVTLNTCVITICNASAGAQTPSAGTYGCRVFNP